MEEEGGGVGGGCGGRERESRGGCGREGGGVGEGKDKEIVGIIKWGEEKRKLMGKA